MIMKNKKQKNKIFLTPQFFPKSRRADISIVLLVILTLVLVISSLFIFVNSSSAVEAEIYDVKFIDQFYLRQNLAEFYVSESVKKAFIKTYLGFVSDSKSIYYYLNNPKETPQNSGNFEFANLHSKLNENFENKFRENFQTEFKKYNFNEGYVEEYLRELNNFVEQGSFNVSLSKGILKMTINDFMIKDAFEKIKIEYFSGISAEFNLTKLGLHDFDKVYEIKEKCKADENLKNCFEIGLTNFNVEVNENNLVTLKSKKDFLIDNDFKKIEFSFIPV